MPEYIDREALLKTLKHRVDGQKHYISDGVNMALSLIEDYVKAIPTADVVEVVRCKNCKKSERCQYRVAKRSFFDNEGKLVIEFDMEHFCSYGERKEE